MKDRPSPPSCGLSTGDDRGGIMKINYYKVKLSQGETVVRAISQQDAERWGMAEFGRSSLVSAELATDKYMEWVKAMGGIIHLTTRAVTNAEVCVKRPCRSLRKKAPK